MYVLVWLCLETREAIVSPSTEHPNSAWVVVQTERFLEDTGSRDRKLEIVIHDMDTNFTREFNGALLSRGAWTNHFDALRSRLPNGRDASGSRHFVGDHFPRYSVRWQDLTAATSVKACASLHSCGAGFALETLYL